MNTSLTISDTLVGSLCREVDSIRHRIEPLMDSIQASRDSGLTNRLKKELQILEKRKLEVRKSAETWLKSGHYDEYSLGFLLEVSSRKNFSRVL